MARYGQKFLDRAVAGLLPPESAALGGIASEVGIDTGMCLCRRKTATVARLEAVIVVAAFDEPEELRASLQATRQDCKRIKELERELLCKDRALAGTAALLVLSKKVAVIFNKGKAE